MVMTERVIVIMLMLFVIFVANLMKWSKKMKVMCEDCERVLYFFNENEADYVLSNHDCGAY